MADETSCESAGIIDAIKYFVRIATQSVDPLSLIDSDSPSFTFRSTSSPPWNAYE